jgi:hypothetical protein
LQLLHIYPFLHLNSFRKYGMLPCSTMNPISKRWRDRWVDIYLVSKQRNSASITVVWWQARSLVSNLTNAQFCISKTENFNAKYTTWRNIIPYFKFWILLLYKIKTKVEKTCNKSYEMLNSSGLEIEIFFSITIKGQHVGMT